jgi:hypothetical protein
MTKEQESERKVLARAIIHRLALHDLKGKAALQTAKNMVMGASNFAIIKNDRDSSQFLHQTYTDIVEFGVNIVYKWAEATPPAPCCEGDKEAA